MSPLIDEQKKKMRLGILSTSHAPLLWYQVSLLDFLEDDDIIIIMDSAKQTDLERELWVKRTGGMFEKMALPLIRAFQNKINKIKIKSVNNHNDNEILEIIESSKISLLLNAGTPRRLKKSILNSTSQGVLNVHPGILPKYRGCTCVEWALHNADPVGNTAHFMDEGYDSGPVVRTKVVGGLEGLTYQQIRVRVHQEGCQLAADVVRFLFDRNMKWSDFPQQNEKESMYWKPIDDVVLEKLIENLNSNSKNNF